MSTDSAPDDTAELLLRAADGDQQAWDALVDRFARLVWAVAGDFRLGSAATEDVYQTVWLRLVENLHKITQPDRLAGWLATTTRHEALRVAKMQRRTRPSDDLGDGEEAIQPTPEEQVVEAGEHAEVLQAFAGLSPSCQRLLRLLTCDPPLDYATVAEMLDRPIGSLGPTRARCLAKLRAQLPSST